MNRNDINIKIDATLDLKPLKEILDSKNLSANGLVQQVIDSEVLRLDDPYVPFNTGNLKQSGIRGTRIGSGEVIYNANYAASQYYNTADTRTYDPMRGAHWFERMKADHRDEIIESARKAVEK